jgi:hypothetical protein
MGVEEKWKANQAKVAFMKSFPGLILAWDNIAGKTVEMTAPLPSRLGGAVGIDRGPRRGAAGAGTGAPGRLRGI